MWNKNIPIMLNQFFHYRIKLYNVTFFTHDSEP